MSLFWRPARAVFAGIDEIRFLQTGLPWNVEFIAHKSDPRRIYVTAFAPPWRDVPHLEVRGAKGRTLHIEPKRGVQSVPTPRELIVLDGGSDYTLRCDGRAKMAMKVEAPVGTLLALA